jgi:hypothetical protein
MLHERQMAMAAKIAAAAMRGESDGEDGDRDRFFPEVLADRGFLVPCR